MYSSCPPSQSISGGTKMVSRPCSQVSAVCYVASICIMLLLHLPLPTCTSSHLFSAFAVCLPAVHPPTTSLPSQDPSSPFTRWHNLPCVPVLLPLLFLTTFSAKDPLQEVPPYLTRHCNSLWVQSPLHWSLQIAKYDGQCLTGGEKSSLLFWISPLDEC